MGRLQDKRLFLLDMDGTIYIGDRLFDGVPEFLHHVRAMGGRYLFLTNNSSRGVEGYMESAASGLTAAIALAERLRGNAEPDFTGKTMLGALERYVRTPNAHFQPMNANFGLLEPLGERVKGKRQRYEKLAERALATLAAFALPKEEETV